MSRKQNNVRVLDWTLPPHHRLPRAQSEQGPKTLGQLKSEQVLTGSAKQKERQRKRKIKQNSYGQPASQPGKLNNAKRETEKLMCVKMKESKAPKITWGTTQKLHQRDSK